MTEQHMPARIWAEQTPNGCWWDPEPRKRATEFIRADIAERLAEALEKVIDYAIDLEVNIECDGGSVNDTENVMDAARSALSAFQSWPVGGESWVVI